MAPPAVAAGIRLAVSSRGGRPAGGEDPLADSVRDRLRLPRGASPLAAGLRVGLAWGFAPILEHLEHGLDAAEWEAMEGTELDETAYEVLRCIAARTRILRSYAVVLEESAEWDRFTRRLVAMRQGAAARLPPVTVAPGIEDESIWWLRPRTIGAGVAATVSAYHALTLHLSASGRERVLQTFWAICIILASIVWMFYGANLLWDWVAVRRAELGGDDATGDVSETESEASAPADRGGSPAVVALR